MFKLNERINVDRLITSEELRALTQNEIEMCKEKTQYIDNYIRYYNSWQYQSLRARRGEEIVFGQSKFKELTDTQKGMITASIAFQDDEIFIRALLKSGATLIDLDGLNNWIPFIREAKKLNQTASGLNIWEKNLLRICSVTKEFFGYDEPHVVMNRINIIITFKRELFTKMEQDYVIEAYKAQVSAEIAKIKKYSKNPKSIGQMKNIIDARERLRSISELDQEIIEGIIESYESQLADTIDQKIKGLKK